MKNTKKILSVILVLFLCVQMFAVSVSAAAASTLKIGSGNYNPGTHTQGKTYSVSGTITSNYKITSVTVGIYTTSNAKKYVQTANPNATSYNINKLDSYMKFASLSAGNYYFKVSAKDASGKTKMLVNNSFTVKAAASTLKIGSGNYKPGTHTQGKTYSVSGTITSNYKITSVVVGIYSASRGTAVYESSAKPNAKSYNISKLDSYMKFASLSVGNYYFRVTATDASGTTKRLVNNAFTVKAVSNAASTLKIGSGNYNPGTHTKGKTYSVSGTITSNYKITSVTAGIYTSSGTAKCEHTAKPNATSYNIKNLDSYMKFASLSVGSYYFRVTATDASGKTIRLVNNAFTVKAAATTSSSSSSSSSSTTVSASNSYYKTMAEATWEEQGPSECVLTSYSMLVKCKLYTEGKSYSHINKGVIRNYNNGSTGAYWDTINSNINSKAGTSGTCTVEVRKDKYTAAQNKARIIELLRTRKEGIVVYFGSAGGNSAHAMRFCNYDSATDTFYVSDPARGGANWKYVTLGKTSTGKTSNIFAYVNRIVYFK